MKIPKYIIIGAILFIIIATSFFHLNAADVPSEQTHRFEYVTIHWAGRDNTHIIRPNGEVEFVGAQLEKIPKPNRTDDRAFYMNIVMNGLAKEGYEIVGISNDDIVMKRAVISSEGVK